MVRITQLKDREDLVGRLGRESLLELIEPIARRKTPIYLWIRFGGEEGHFYFREGKLVCARSRSLRGKEAAYHLLAFHSGIFRIVAGREPETENVEIDWQQFKAQFREELQNLVLGFLHELEGKFIFQLSDYKGREIFHHTERGARALAEILEQLFSSGAEFGLKNLVRGLEPKITEWKGEQFASIFYLPELRYFIGVAGDKAEQKKISAWVLEKFMPAAREAAAIALRRSDHLTRRAGILAVLPDPALHQPVSNALAAAGFKVWICADGFEGLVRVEDYRPDLIILQSELGRISSAEVYARLKRKEDSQLIPVVCLTPEPRRSDPESAASGDLYLELPFSGRKLVKVVENLLELK